MVRGNSISRGEYYDTNLCNSKQIDEYINKAKKMAELCDRLDSITIYSSMSGSMGTYGLNRLRNEFKCPITFISTFPESDRPHSVESGPLEIYNFPHHISNMEGEAHVLMLTNSQLYKYCTQ